jgi:hypothetical protein
MHGRQGYLCGHYLFRKGISEPIRCRYCPTEPTSRTIPHLQLLLHCHFLFGRPAAHPVRPLFPLFPQLGGTVSHLVTTNLSPTTDVTCDCPSTGAPLSPDPSLTKVLSFRTPSCSQRRPIATAPSKSIRIASTPVFVACWLVGYWRCTEYLNAPT